MRGTGAGRAGSPRRRARLGRSQSVLAPAVALRQGEAQLAASGLGIPRSQTSLTHQAELVLGHRALETQQQAIVDVTRIVDAVEVDDEGAGQSAQIDQVMPGAPLAGEPRGFQAIDGADAALADRGDELLEAGPDDQPGAGAAEVVVDGGHRHEACGLGGLDCCKRQGNL